MNVEQLLTERIGDTGKRLHTGRSRNDQVALDMRLYVKKEITEIIKLILGFMKALCDKEPRESRCGHAGLHASAACTADHVCTLYDGVCQHAEARRHAACRTAYERMDEMPLGSGALASTTYPIDRDFVREQLGFARLTDNSLDGVSDRDYCVELLLRAVHPDDAPVPPVRGDHLRGAHGSSSSSSWTMRIPPARPSCRRRRTRTCASSSAARPAVCTVR